MGVSAADGQECRRRSEVRDPAQGEGHYAQGSVLVNAVRRVEEAQRSVEYVVAAFSNYV